MHPATRSDLAGPVSIHQRRHLDRDCATMTQMTHAATNTAGLAHLRVISASAQEPLQQGQKKKRGPKVGRKAAGREPGYWPATDAHPAMTQQTAGGDPYAFHCETTMKINYSAEVADTLSHHQQRNDNGPSKQTAARQLNLLQDQCNNSTNNEFSKQGYEIIDEHELNAATLSSSSSSKQQNTNQISYTHEPDQMIAHKQHLVPPANQPPGRQVPQQQQLPVVGHARQHHVAGEPRQYYAPVGNVQQQQQQQQYSANTSNTSADNQIYHQQQHHQHHHHQQQIISNNHNPQMIAEQQQQANSMLRFHHRAQPVGNQQQAPLIGEQPQYHQQQQYNHSMPVEQHPHPQAQPQVPQPNQLPYHHNHNHQQQQQQQAYEPATQMSNHYVNSTQQPDAHLQQHQLIHDPQQQRHLGPAPMRPHGQVQQTRVSPYSSNHHHHHHHHHQQQQQQMQPVRPAPVRVAGGQQQYKPAPADFQQHHHHHHQIPQQHQPAPQAQLVLQPPPPANTNPQQAPTNYPNCNNAYLMNGTNPPFMEGDQTSSPTTLLQQQLNRQVPAQRLGHPVHHHQQQSPSPNHQMHPRQHNSQPHPTQQHHPRPPIYGPPTQQAATNKVRTTLYVNNEPDPSEPYEIRAGSRLNPPIAGPRPGIVTQNGDQCYSQVAPANRVGPPSQQRLAPQRAAVPNHHHHYQQQQQMMAMENTHIQQQHQQPPPNLLGNPTPPLTPNSNPLGGPRTGISQPAADASNHSAWQAQHHGAPAMGCDHVQQSPANRYNVGSPSLVGANKLHSNLPEGHHLQQQPRIMPKSVASTNNTSNNSFQHQQQKYNPNLAPPSHQPLGPSPVDQRVVDHQARLTLPLRDAPLLGPFRLEHDEQISSRVFHIKPQLFEALSKSMNLVNPQAATVIQELQFRAYVVGAGPTGKQTNGTNHSPHGDSLLASNNQQQQQAKPCNWPEHLQVCVNENVIQLDRSKVGAHKAVDIFQYCRMGDNVLEMQVNDCYCSHEFVLEPVDRPTLKAFMSSCFKSRRLATEACVQKLKFNFGSPAFLLPHQHHSGVINEYLSEFGPNGVEQSKARISLRCPISGRRMRTPTRGYHCKHLQCFDLEVFLSTNRERTRWSCPLCSLAVPFNMLELDQYQMDMLHAMPPDTDDILVDESGQWQAYYAPASACSTMQQPLAAQQQQPIMQTAKSTGTYHPQAPTVMSTSGTSPLANNHQPLRPQSGPIIPTANPRMHSANNQAPGGSMSLWDPASGQQQQHLDACHSPMGPVRRPASAISQPTGRRSANGSPLAKKAFTGQYAGQQAQQQPGYFSGVGDQVAAQSSSSFSNDTDDLSPLAAMERTIIQHEQQMGPPPFDPNSLTSSPAPVRSSPAAAAAAANNNSSSLISPNPASAATTTNAPTPNIVAVQTSPAANAQAAFSPASHGIASSPAGARMVPASPQQQRLTSHGSDIPPQSPMPAAISTPATPSATSSMPVHGAGLDAPPTPSQVQGQHSVSIMNHSPHVVSTAGGSSSSNSLIQQQSAAAGGVDHQPLSNGSASAGSITSSSTMTPSSQSLGSVGMGGDSRCGTAPLQVGGQLGLDDLMLPGGVVSSHQAGMSHQFKHSPHLDDKSEIMMGKLMMDSSESLLHRNGELAMALEEAEWKQQLDRGKSEHLANFLNEPLMKKQQQHHYQQQQHHTQQGPGSKMLSGGLEPSEDEGNQSHGSSPGHNIEQLEFANYLDTGDNGAGLPPDDSILDLFER